MKMCFIDTNIVVYANDRNAKEKQSTAINLIASLMRTRTGIISIQVLQEYANTALAKLHQKPDVVLRQLKLLESLTIITPIAKTVRRSVEIQGAYGITFWDAAIVAAAEEVDCEIIFSEDLNPGQYYGGAQVVNPFVGGFSLGGIA